MKKTLIVAAIVLTVSANANANANLSVTSMTFGGDYAATGSINDDGTMGLIESLEDFSSFPWTATQQTAVITNSNDVTWAGTNATGTWDYASDIANMTDNQLAVGIFWNWNSLNDIAFLAVFDCTSGTVCLGQTIGADGNVFDGNQAGAITGDVIAFSGNGNLSAVPILSTVWLFGSGLIGLIGIARRKA